MAEIMQPSGMMFLQDRYATTCRANPAVATGNVIGSLDSSVPNTSSSMMWYRWLAFFFSFFCQIVQEKIDQDSINFRIGMLFHDLPLNQLDCPDTAAPQLDFPTTSWLKKLLCPDCCI